MSSAMYRVTLIPSKTGWPQVDRLLKYLESVGCPCIAMEFQHHMDGKDSFSFEFMDGNPLGFHKLFCPTVENIEKAIDHIENELDILTEPYGDTNS